MKPSQLFCLSMAAMATAQSFVPPPNNLEVVLSERFPGASISYKQVNNLCETTEGVRSFSGYVSLPKDFIPDATGWDNGVSGHYFFWYFEARNDPKNAPTSVYLGGGPGYTAFDGSSVFPCFVNPDSNSTIVNKHSWNNNANMLYVEQPLGTGFSYTTLVNGSLDILTGNFTSIADEADLPELSPTTQQATLQDPGAIVAANTTMTAARTFWRFAQVWFNEFPESITKNDDISIWAVSYGGLYAPAFASYFIDQNELIREEKHELANATALNMATVGLLNAFVDARSMALGFPDWARNNTYGLPVYSEDVYTDIVFNITDPEEGLIALIDRCRAAVAEGDPDGKGANETVNEACVTAAGLYSITVLENYEAHAPYGSFDITYNRNASLPTAYETALFNQPWVQVELGVPLNYTRGNDQVEAAFLGLTGDIMRYGLDHLGHLLDNGVNVAMANGDRDFRCNWFSGQNASLNIPFDSANKFATAGYEPIKVSSSHKGGFVREYGNLSFSRIFQAGHSTGGYQPETMSAVFNRAMFRFDVATGKTNLTKKPNYRSRGPSNVRHVKNKLPKLIDNVCYVLQTLDTCNEAQLEALADGTAETKDWLVVKPAGTKGKRLNGSHGRE